MPSERVQRRINRLLDQAEIAADTTDWSMVVEYVAGVLALDAENEDAIAFRNMAEQAKLASTSQKTAEGTLTSDGTPPDVAATSDAVEQRDAQTPPSSFADGRYTVSRLLGEGGKKLVYLAHDATLDRDVAFAVVKTEGLDEIGRERILREAQAMGRMGTHPCIMPIYDLGEEDGNPYMVQPLMSGGRCRRTHRGCRRRAAVGTGDPDSNTDRRGTRFRPLEGHHPS